MAGRPTARCTASPGPAAAADDSDTERDALSAAGADGSKSTSSTVTPNSDDERVQRAHGGLHLARLDLRDRARRQVESSCKLAQADPAAETNRAKPRAELRRGVRVLCGRLVASHHANDVRNGIIVMSVDRIHDFVCLDELRLTGRPQPGSTYLAVDDGGGDDQEALEDVLPLLIEAEEDVALRT